MEHLTTIKCCAALQKVTPLVPVLRNATRWSSTFNMVGRYVKLHPALLSMDHATIAKHDIVSYLLDEDESSRAKSLLESLMDLNEVNKVLQDSTLTTVGARRAFNWVGRQYPSMKARLSPDAAIVNYPALESGIVKIISRTRLSACEQEAFKMFKKPVADPAPETNSRSFLAPVFKKAVKGATSYMPLAIPHVERVREVLFTG